MEAAAPVGLLEGEDVAGAEPEGLAAPPVEEATALHPRPGATPLIPWEASPSWVALQTAPAPVEQLAADPPVVKAVLAQWQTQDLTVGSWMRLLNKGKLKVPLPKTEES